MSAIEMLERAIVGWILDVSKGTPRSARDHYEALDEVAQRLTALYELLRGSSGIIPAIVDLDRAWAQGDAAWSSLQRIAARATGEGGDLC